MKDIDCVVTSVSCLPFDGFPWHEFQLIVRYEKGDCTAFNHVGRQASATVNCKLVVLHVVGYSLQQGITELDRRTNGTALWCRLIESLVTIRGLLRVEPSANDLRWIQESCRRSGPIAAVGSKVRSVHDAC